MSMIYLICFLAGLILSGLSLVSGAHGVHLFGHHAGGHGHGHHVSGGHGHGDAHPHALPGTVAPRGVAMAALTSMNMAALTAFLAWFGGAGLVLAELTHWPSLLIGCAAIAIGIAGGALVNRFIGALTRDSRPLEPVSRVGMTARVTSPIREAGGTGEVVYSLDGTRQVAAARSDDQVAVAKGTEVVIVRYEKGIAYVSTFEELSAITRES